MVVEFEGKSIQLPDVMIVGAAKCGSTTLYRLLTESEEVFFPHMQKEPYYFCNQGRYPEQEPKAVKRMVWKTDDFIDLYTSARPTQTLFDGSTIYLYRHEQSIAHIRSMYGEHFDKVKIIIMLRDPVDRAFSHYNFLRLLGWEDLSFEEALRPEQISARLNRRWSFDYLGFGDYHAQVQAYKEAFPQCLIVKTEELQRSNEIVKKVCQFIGIAEFVASENVKANPSGTPKNNTLVPLIKKNRLLKQVVNWLSDSNKNKVLNVRDLALSKLLRKETMKPSTEDMLIEYYRDKREPLEQLTGLDLSSWKT